jgi:hypothetical protein
LPAVTALSNCVAPGCVPAKAMAMLVCTRAGDFSSAAASERYSSLPVPVKAAIRFR